MFCGKCGHEVNDDDEFCRNCGAPIHPRKESHNSSNESPASHEGKSESDESSSFLCSWSKSKKFFVYTVVSVILLAILSGMALPKGISFITYLTDSRGFTAFIAGNTGGAILPFALSLPLISGLHKVGVTKKAYRIEGFYFALLFYSIGELFVGRTVWNGQYLPPIMIVVFIAGMIVWLSGKYKNA